MGDALGLMIYDWRLLIEKKKKMELPQYDPPEADKSAGAMGQAQD